MVALLPLGAYVAQRVLPVMPQPSAAQAAPEVAQADDTTIVTSERRKCRGPALPGTSCNPLLFFEPPAALPEPSAQRPPFEPADPARSVGRVPSGALDPPRFG